MVYYFIFHMYLLVLPYYLTVSTRDKKMERPFCRKERSFSPTIILADFCFCMLGYTRNNAGVLKLSMLESNCESPALKFLIKKSYITGSFIVDI